jgi:DNA-binding NarL/FixJ family response regulator
MAASVLRLLVVDDFEPWRRFVRTMIQGIPDAVIVGEASDGREAIEKARKLRPDLVLLDIGLPFMNGIEVAREIGKISPESSIVFLTENPSSDVMEECFSAGASRYVVKSSAANDLIPAIKAALKRKAS